MRRRRRSARRRYYPKRRRRRYRRNPGGRGIVGQVTGLMPTIGWGLVGYAGTSLVPTFAARFVPLPDRTTNPVGHFAVKGGAAIATGWIVGQFIGRTQGRYAMLGGLFTLGTQVFDQFLAPMLGMGDYLYEPQVATYLNEPEPAMGYLSPGQVVPGEQMGAVYTEPPVRLNPSARF